MGASYYAYAVIGVEATGKLHTITQEPSCAHQPTGAFCSTCGKPNKPVDVETPIAGYDEDEQTIGTLRVAHTTDKRKSFVGIVVGTKYDENNQRLPLALSEVTARIEDLRKQLDEIGLWDEASFGLWAVSYCSY